MTDCNGNEIKVGDKVEVLHFYFDGYGEAESYHKGVVAELDPLKIVYEGADIDRSHLLLYEENIEVKK